jgi:uncharacterized protein (DUF1778 family)
MSELVHRKAVEAVENDVLNRTVVTIPANDWEKFETWLNRPAETIPSLVKLVKVIPPWKR